MIRCVRTNSNDLQFQQLALELENDLRIRDGEDHLFYSALNKIAYIEHVIVAYEDKLPVGCGAIREYAASTMEIKRMFIIPAMRGRGVASLILKTLEDWGRELGYNICRLETGLNQPEAIAFYKKQKYIIIPNFGKYKDSSNSICFEKTLV